MFKLLFIVLNPFSDALLHCRIFNINFCNIKIQLFISVPGPPVQAKAVLGGIAKLPCDINPPLMNDSAILVVWYKAPERSSDIIPIYR